MRRTTMLLPVLVAALAPMLLSACSDPDASGAASEPAAVASAGAGDGTVAGIAGAPAADKLNASSRKLVAAEPVLQNVTMRRVVTSGGEACSSVDAMAYWGSYRGKDMFHVRCEDGGDWLVSIDDDDTTGVMACSVAAKMGTDCAVPGGAS